jgi:hypothetical protein
MKVLAIRWLKWGAINGVLLSYCMHVNNTNCSRQMSGSWWGITNFFIPFGLKPWSSQSPLSSTWTIGWSNCGQTQKSILCKKEWVFFLSHMETSLPSGIKDYYNCEDQDRKFLESNKVKRSFCWPSLHWMSLRNASCEVQFYFLNSCYELQYWFFNLCSFTCRS